MPTRIATLALTGLLGLAGAVAAEDAGAEAAAGPALVLRVAGACPDAAQVRAALPAGVEVASADAAEAASADGAGRARAATLEIRSTPGGATVRLAPVVGVALEVALDGRDCALLAAAAAAIADAWLVELGAPAGASSRAAPPPASPPPSASPRVAAAASSSAASPAPPAPPAPSPGVESSGGPTAAAASSGWTLGVARAAGRTVGADLALAGGAAATRLDLAWASPRSVRRLRGRLDWGARAELLTGDGEMAGIDRQAWSVGLAAAARARRGRLWGEGAAGLAVVLSHVRAPGVEAPVEPLRLHPMLGLGAAAGVHLGGGVSVRLELDGQLFPVRDRYTAPPDRLARSPRAAVAAALGLEVTLGERSW